MSKSQSHKIGIFDSGVGGLTVLREIYQQLPCESIIYLADTARLPYGTRCAEEILEFVREILDWMQQQQVKMVIMACNTGSALALETVRQEYKFPILGVILPGAQAAVGYGKRLGVIATPATVASNAYLHAIREIDSQSQVWQVSCPEFVPLIEQNRIQDPYTQQIVKQYLQPLIDKQIDTLIYGCTHYPYLENLICKLVPTALKLVDPAKYVVKAASAELELLGIKNTTSAVATRFCVTGTPQTFAHLSRQWLGFTPQVESVKLKHKMSVFVDL